MNTDPNTTSDQGNNPEPSVAPSTPPASPQEVPINKTPPETPANGTVWRFDGAEHDDKDNRAEF